MFISGINIGTDEYTLAEEIIAADINYETSYIQPDDPVHRTVKESKALLGTSRDMLLRQAQHRSRRKIWFTDASVAASQSNTQSKTPRPPTCRYQYRYAQG